MSQVQCENWPDLQAPKTTSVLLDLFSRVDELLVERPGTVLVHCSAGVGRTGAFLALFKLIKDYERGVSHEIFNKCLMVCGHCAIKYCMQVTLDPFSTVLEMRRQRKKMIQKPVQYNYVINCLADHARQEVSDYV